MSNNTCKNHTLPFAPYGANFNCDCRKAAHIDSQEEISRAWYADLATFSKEDQEEILEIANGSFTRTPSQIAEFHNEQYGW
jgi:hypothetical protein